MGLAEGEHKRHRGRARRGQAGAVRGSRGWNSRRPSILGEGCSCSLGGPDVRGPALPGLPRCTPVLSLFPTEPERIAGSWSSDLALYPWLGDLRQVSVPLWAFVSSPGNHLRGN